MASALHDDCPNRLEDGAFGVKGKKTVNVTDFGNPLVQSKVSMGATKKGQPPRHRANSRKLRNQLAACASFPERVLFLDIETTGLSHYYDEITVVGMVFRRLCKDDRQGAGCRTTA